MKELDRRQEIDRDGRIWTRVVLEPGDRFDREPIHQRFPHSHNRLAHTMMESTVENYDSDTTGDEALKPTFYTHRMFECEYALGRLP